jgi:DNA-binding NarL/FixJ family response regulator
MYHPPPKKLQDIWNKKLKNSGFVDIEDALGRLKEHSTSITLLSRGWNPVKVETQTRYFQLVGNFLNDNKDFTDIQRIIWEMHGQGLTLRQIAKNINWSKSGVHIIVSKFRKKMLKLYGVTK